MSMLALASIALLCPLGAATSEIPADCDTALSEAEQSFFENCFAHNGYAECPPGCQPLLESLHLVCNGRPVTAPGLFDEYEAGPTAIHFVDGFNETGSPCGQAAIDAVLRPAAFEPTCVDGLYTLAVLLKRQHPLVSRCQVASDESRCPEECGLLLEGVAGTCSPADVGETAVTLSEFPGTEISVRGLLDVSEPLLSPSCAALLEASVVAPSSTTTRTSVTGPTNTSTSSETATTTTASSLTTFICQGNATAWNVGYGNCSTYAPNSPTSWNAYWCDKDVDEDTNLFAEQVCPECGLCTPMTEAETIVSGLSRRLRGSALARI